MVVLEGTKEHLLDSLLTTNARKLGGHAFVMGKYWKLETSQSVKGDSMADLLPLLQVLGSLCPSLEFKYSTLKNCYQEVLKQFPVIQVSEMAMLPPELSRMHLVFFAAMPGGLAGMTASLQRPVQRLLLSRWRNWRQFGSWFAWKTRKLCYPQQALPPQKSKGARSSFTSSFFCEDTGHPGDGHSPNAGREEFKCGFFAG